MPVSVNYRCRLCTDSLIAVILALRLLLFLTRVGHSTCHDPVVYFPMSAVKLNLPFNEKSQSIFSKIPIGRFQILPVGKDNEDRTKEYLYTLDNNELLHVNGSTGEVFMKDDYQTTQKKTKIILTAIPRNEHKAALDKIPQMTLEVTPQAEAEYCANLENVCFWDAAQYTIVEDATAEESEQMSAFENLRVGTLNPRATRYLCPTMDVKYTLTSGDKYFTLKNNEIYTKVPLDYEYFNTTEVKNFAVNVACTIKMSDDKTLVFNRTLHVALLDRNDNGPELQNEGVYNFLLDNPHFKQGDTIGNKIIFTDRDSLRSNAHLTYQIFNDTSELVRPDCTAYEADHTGKIKSIFSCQILFARNGILSQTSYCFSLVASDHTVNANTIKTAKANICLSSDPSKIHEADRPRVLELRQQRGMSRRLTNVADSILENDNKGFLAPSILSTYPKDVFLHRTAMSYSRVAQPENYQSLMEMSEVRFTIAEDRSGAFGITTSAGIIYVKDTAALEKSLETVYFLNITWHDSHQRSFVVNVHLVDGQPNNATCEHKIKSRSQTCAQIKYQKQCTKFCGLGTNGGACAWRGSNAGFFGRNYASCVPDATYCADNVCDPLEELNTFICPQDCVGAGKIMGPHTSNPNKRGIYSASGTCTCEDNGKCMCAPLDDEEPRPKRKRKNDTKSLDVNKMTKFGGTDITQSAQNNLNNGVIEHDAMSIHVAGFTCGRSCILLAITCPIILIVLLICLIATQRNLIRRTRGKEALSQKSSANGDCDVRNGDVPLMQLESGLAKFDTVDSKWEFDRAKLQLDVVLGEGEFGKVMKAYASNIADIPGVTTVAVKMLKSGANSVEYMALLSEFQLLQEVSHPNVIKLLGACTKGDAPMIIIEYAKYGSLRSYLRLSRKIECSGVDFTDGVEPITVKNILSFAWQICKGMAYLTEIKLVHRDLAARNVLLADGKICKVSDFGLTRDVYEDDAYLKRSRDRVPVKWMAPESLADHVYTTKSDVWAFGVLCWELITLGASPYPGIPPQNLYHLLKTGYRMEKPENCSEEIYSIVRTCWIDDPNARPSFKYLASQFEKLLGNNAKFIEMESSAISNPMYCIDEAKLIGASQPDLTACLEQQLGEPDPLDHLWQSPKICYDTQECPSSREFSTNFSMEFQQTPPPPGYDVPRPLIETATTEQTLRYENDLRFPLNIRKSVCNGSITSNSQNGSKAGGGYGVGAEADGSDGVAAHYSMPVKRGRSYVDMTNKTFIPDNLDGDEFEKHLSKTISFRFSSQLNLKEQDLGAV
ncbi:proto-oncogene tyrosine-protein kinase receptor Ret isoform X10 [Bactrocera dorsalis]|uniref:Proto-oncogene tyrosine-protein kinase receptor Ret isoform X10 n=1 Tax=Bactrocera dorsalis TaxID=27457 RepID=A0ABM3J001_BACDO|nr:proto-oncogene tyrosine-protein kinase receptor Ret isoform X5 [Bactrocera dorsalis]XP_049302564.1 proto-oncogene tyrosine-protein kinase receptor Ret isoform X7 [Bactrocera dorsalis]XP_049302565.1 proto-oncogene tyrosine-protein kinase receptor Ret isoform X8 [Bactrocera dorsalis]XP_049302566.1 proto-oncogene tyrosine-protein kinase receptor Ret isoform X9 [Bactrocera dorsalis]XP_049302567.1 proto-oncogene tyrosine-protein kinase receptor Ret isoform X10 [Bactrocera dorsalis]